jgi:hypothetical protein
LHIARGGTRTRTTLERQGILSPYYVTYAPTYNTVHPRARSKSIKGFGSCVHPAASGVNVRHRTDETAPETAPGELATLRCQTASEKVRRKASVTRLILGGSLRHAIWGRRHNRETGRAQFLGAFARDGKTQRRPRGFDSAAPSSSGRANRSQSCDAIVIACLSSARLRLRASSFAASADCLAF